MCYLKRRIVIMKKDTQIENNEDENAGKIMITADAIVKINHQNQFQLQICISEEIEPIFVHLC